MEMSALFLFVSIAHTIHQNQGRSGNTYWQLLGLLSANLTILFVLYHNKSYLAQSVHLFSTSFLFKIEFPLVKTTLVITILYLVSLRRVDFGNYPNARLALVLPILAYMALTLVVALSEVLVFTRPNAIAFANATTVVLLLSSARSAPTLEIPAL